MWKKSKSEEKNANARLLKGAWFVAKNYHNLAENRIKTLKYKVLIAFKGRMSSNISLLFVFKSKIHVPYTYKVYCAFQTQKAYKTTKMGYFLDLKRLDLQRIANFDIIYLFQAENHPSMQIWLWKNQNWQTLLLSVLAWHALKIKEFFTICFYLAKTAKLNRKNV